MSKVTLEKSQEQYIVDVNGNKTAEILDIELYEQMLEDIHDMAVVGERRSQQSINLAEMKRWLDYHQVHCLGRFCNFLISQIPHPYIDFYCFNFKNKK